jgi:hypothetical protein
MKKIQVTINPTEIKSVTYNNSFTKKQGERFSLQIKSEAAIKLNPTNPVMALVVLNINVDDPDGCIQINMETITGITVSTFIDDLEGFIRTKYLPIIMMQSNEKVRSLTTTLGMPIRLPNPVFGEGEAEASEGLTQ